MLGGCTWAQSALILNALELPAEGVRVIQNIGVRLATLHSSPLQSASTTHDCLCSPSLNTMFPTEQNTRRGECPASAGSHRTQLDKE
jgi:hypothetical protein